MDLVSSAPKVTKEMQYKIKFPTQIESQEIFCEKLWQIQPKSNKIKSPRNVCNLSETKCYPNKKIN